MRFAMVLSVWCVGVACVVSAPQPAESTPTPPPGTPATPRIVAFEATPRLVPAGGTATLTWTVTDADEVLLDPGGTPSGASLSVKPTSSTTYTLVARSRAGEARAQATVTVRDAGGADVVAVVRPTDDLRPISPFVYGYNAARAASAPPGATWLRVGGLRWSTWNWTNNWSNAGADLHYQNDTYLGATSDGPAVTPLTAIADAKAHGLGLLLTVPLQGNVARSGEVWDARGHPDVFVPLLARKGAPFTQTPDPASTTVYQDELVALLAARWAGATTPLHLSLDNEPDLWAVNLEAVQAAPLTVQALLDKTLATARAIKDVAPSALLYGPVSYGWSGYVSLQNAPDAVGSTIDDSFLDRYLQTLADAGAAEGRRLLDVLDVHYFSEAQGCGARVTDAGAGDSDCVAAARAQAPRSLWDASYVEPSWITRLETQGAPVRLLPRLFDKIARHAPGTRLAISAWSHGGGTFASGAVAVADTLGGLGRNGVYAAAYWPLAGGEPWAQAAFRAFRGYDGGNAAFGDTSVAADSSDAAHVGVWASVDGAAPDRVVAVVVHRPAPLGQGSDGLQSRVVRLYVDAPHALQHARAFQLAPGAAPQWTEVPVQVAANALTLQLPAMSVTTVELTP